MLFISIISSAQTTKVRGRVTDADTGEGIPFAGVYFKNTTIGITTDLDGYYTLETRDKEALILTCQLLGYDTQEKEITFGTFNTVNFPLKLTNNELVSAVVKADNKKVRRLLANIEKNRNRNNPEARPSYNVDVYSKMEMDLTNAKEQIKNKRFLREFGFVFDYMDTSAVSGVPYLPVMISESIINRRHTLEPAADDETIIANQISGINQDNNLLTQFTGSLRMKTNFYTPFINTFGLEFPSPIQNAGLLYYNYYIVDSVQVDNRKTYIVHYHPKKGISSPTFDGEMQIDAEEYALRSIHAKMTHGGNVNWLRDVTFDVEYRRLNDSTWFYQQDNMYADFSIAFSDSSRVMSVIGTRQLTYRDPDFSPMPVSIDKAGGKVKVEKDSNFKTEEYWQKERPYELTQKEKNIYRMVDKIKDQPLYHDLYTTVYTIATGYLDLGPVGIGPYLKLFSVNNLEGFRPRIGIHTSKDFSKDFRLTAFVAYGTKDEAWKGGITYERLFSKEPQRKLTVDAQYDVFQFGLGQGNNGFTSGNILASFWHGQQRLAPRSNFSVLYDHEFSMNFNAQAEIAMKRYYSNEFVPMKDWAGNNIPSVAANEVRLQARFSREETVNRGHFIKTYVHTFYPVWTFNLTGSVPGIRKGDYGWFRPEVTMDWRFKIPPVGISKLKINVGTVVGKVPYPMLHIHEGNVTNLLDKTAFACMDYFEFASDFWTSLFYEHNFHGFFLGKIPLIRKLQMREEVYFKATYGTLRDENNGLRAEYGALMPFPAGMKTLGKVPYVEVGVGLSNILRLFRVACLWRVTHLQDEVNGVMIPVRRKFTIDFGVDFQF